MINVNYTCAFKTHLFCTVYTDKVFADFVYSLGLTDHQRASHVDVSFPPSCPALLHRQEHRALPRLWNISHQNLELQQKPQCTCFFVLFCLRVITVYKKLNC